MRRNCCTRSDQVVDVHLDLPILLRVMPVEVVLFVQHGRAHLQVASWARTYVLVRSTDSILTVIGEHVRIRITQAVCVVNRGQITSTCRLTPHHQILIAQGVSLLGWWRSNALDHLIAELRALRCNTPMVHITGGCAFLDKVHYYNFKIILKSR